MVRRRARPARYGHGTGRVRAPRMHGMEIGNDHQSPVGGAPNRTRIHRAESVKRLLCGAVDDNGGYVPGLAGNTMVPAYCSADPFGVKT